MKETDASRRTHPFAKLREAIDSDPERRARVDQHKFAMLADVRKSLDVTQVVLAERLDVTQENISHIERGEADVRLSTLRRYVEALGGRLEVRATFADQSVELDLGTAAKRSRGDASPA